MLRAVYIGETTIRQPQDSVREILLTFCNGRLYRMSATYDRSAIEGLTTEDLMQSIAAKYGPR